MTLHSSRLDYAPQIPPWYHHKRVRQIAVGIAVFIVIYYWGYQIWHQQVRRQFAQDWRSETQACMEYTAPANQIVFDDDPRDFGQLDDCNVIMRRNGQAAAGRKLNIWSYSLISIPALTKVSDAFVFLHARKSKSGNQRLIVIWSPMLFEQDFNLHAAVILAPNAPFDQLVGKEGMNFDSTIPHNSTLRVFAGQPDPFDDSHFTIGYEADHHAGTIDGWLEDDDTVKLTIQPAPTTKPSSPGG
jgi:hypothetical protein